MRIFRVLPLALICLVGCGGPSVVGKWSTTEAGGTSTLEFTSDTFKQSNEGAGMKMEASGTYKFDGKKLTMTVTDIKVPDQLKAMITPELMAKAKSTPSIVDVKLEGDKLTLTPEAGGAMASKGGTFTRVK